AITHAINTFGGTGLWDDADGFYYDQLALGEQRHRLKVRSLVGLLPLCAVEVLPQATIDRLPGFGKRLRWFLAHERALAGRVTFPASDQLERVLRYLFGEAEFRSPYGIRSLSAVHRDQPSVFHSGGAEFRVGCAPAESTSDMFGGNSNWRGPVWFPLNYLLVE